jgi:hypothetical protein
LQLETEKTGTAKMSFTTFLRRGSLFALVAAATLAASGTNAVPGFDGLWSVSIVTEKGACDRGYRYPVRITNGVLANAGSVNISIVGKVQPTGAITVIVSAAGKSANGTGRLSGDLGEGRWTGGECSGTWTAERRSAAE